MPSAQEIHAAHQAGASAQVKLDLARLVRGDLERAVSYRAQANLSLGARLLSEAAAKVGGDAGALLSATASFLGQARLDLASGKSPSLVLGGGVSGAFSFPPLFQVKGQLLQAAGKLALDPSAKTSLKLVDRMVQLAVAADAKGLDFRAGVALPLAREVALRAGVKLNKDRKLELALGFAGRLQLKLGG